VTVICCIQFSSLAVPGSEMKLLSQGCWSGQLGIIGITEGCCLSIAPPLLRLELQSVAKSIFHSFVLFYTNLVLSSLTLLIMFHNGELPVLAFVHTMHVNVIADKV
jgi:hypothetical protein